MNPSAISRWTASRSGSREVSNRSAMVRSLSFWPGASVPSMISALSAS
jgi:hypothetical protein